MKNATIGEFCTLVDAAIMLKMCKQTVIAWIKKGYIEGYKVGPGGCWRVKLQSINDFVTKHFDEKPMPHAPLGGWPGSKNQVQLPIGNNTEKTQPVVLDDKVCAADSRIMELHNKGVKQGDIVRMLTEEKLENTRHKVSWSQASISTRIKHLRLRGLLRS